MLCTGYTKMTNQNKNRSIRTQYNVKCYTEGVPQKKNITASFTEHLKVQAKKTFTHAL